MLLTCPRCDKTHVIADDLVPADGAVVECTRCSHTFQAHGSGESEVLGRLLTCPQCAITYVLPRVPRRGEDVQCTRCSHRYEAPAPPRPDLLMSGLMDGSDRVGMGRVIFSAAPRANEATEGQSLLLRSGPGTNQHIIAVSAPTARDPMLESLYEQVWAKPDDDAPRHVLADYLTERGDLRGEFIEIQLAEPDGPTGLAKGRAKALARLIPQWLPRGVEASTAVFRRGFLVECRFIGPTTKTHREWKTVERLDCAEAPEPFSAFAPDNPFFTHRELPLLKELLHVSDWTFATLGDGLVRLEVLRTLRVPFQLFEERRDLMTTFPALHTLDLERTVVDALALRFICQLLARRETLSHVRSPTLCLDDQPDRLRLREALEVVHELAPALTVRLYVVRDGPWLELGRDGVRLCRRAGAIDEVGVRLHFHTRARAEGLTALDVVVDPEP